MVRAVIAFSLLALILPHGDAAQKRAVAADATGAGRVLRDCPACPEMVVLPAGEFMMGSPESEKGRNKDEGPQRKVTIADGAMHDRTGYTPYAGRTVTGWPETVIRRGETVIRGGRLSAAAGSGQFLPRSGGVAATPRRELTPDMDPARNLGAELL